MSWASTSSESCSIKDVDGRDKPSDDRWDKSALMSVGSSALLSAIAELCHHADYIMPPVEPIPHELKCGHFGVEGTGSRRAARRFRIASPFIQQTWS
jgi:hypothetical protein